MSSNASASANAGHTSSQSASPGRKKPISGAYKTFGALRKAGGKIVKVKGAGKRKKRRGSAGARGDDNDRNYNGAHRREQSPADNDDVMSVDSDGMDEEDDIFASTHMTMMADDKTPLISNTIFRRGIGADEGGGERGTGGVSSNGIEKVTSGYETMARNAFIISLAFAAGAKYGAEIISTASFVSATLCTMWLGSIVTTRMGDSSGKTRDQNTRKTNPNLQTHFDAVSSEEKGVSPKFRSLSKKDSDRVGASVPSGNEEECNPILLTRSASDPGSPVSFRKYRTKISLGEEGEEDSSRSASPNLKDNNLQKELQHPELLSKLFVLNADNLDRIVPNSGPYVLDNDYFCGSMNLMIRTPDVDDPSGSVKLPVESTAAQVSDYFRDKKRQFEFQFQVKMKKLPPGPLYLGCELDAPLKLGMIQRAFVSTILGVVGKMNPGLHYSFGMDESGYVPKESAVKEGRYEKTHLSFLLEASMDRIVISKPGEPIPALGGVINEDPESVKRRKRVGTGSVEWNLEDTYTMSFWSAYVSYMQWKCLNLPGTRPFSLSTVAGEQPVNMTVYAHRGSTGTAAHHRRDMVIYSHIEISNTATTRGGLFDKYEDVQRRRVSIAESKTSASFDGDLDDDDEEEADEDLVVIGAEDSSDDEEEEVSELGDGMYLKSSDQIFLAIVPSYGNSVEPNVGHLTNVGGFAVLQSHESPSRFIVERAPAQYQTGTERQRKSQLIHDGDTVSVKICQQNEVRYLSTHRGWWLKWVSTPPRHNGFFHITVHNDAGEVRDEIGDSDAEPAGPIVSLGAPFSLRHRRWKHYEVGFSTDGSAKFGGRLLGLHRVLDDNGKFIAGREERFEKPDYVDGKGDNKWLERLTLCANFPASSIDLLSLDAVDNAAAKMGPMLPNGPLGRLTLGLVTMDVSAWIETVHRTKRSRQRAYVVRVHQRSKPGSDDKGKWFTWIRTGRDLTPILQLRRSTPWIDSFKDNGEKEVDNPLGAPRGSFESDNAGDREEVDSESESESESDNEQAGQNPSPATHRSRSVTGVDFDRSSLHALRRSLSDADMSSRPVSLADDMSDESTSPPTFIIKRQSLDEDEDETGADMFQSVHETNERKKNWIQHSTHEIAKAAKTVGKGTLKVAQTVEKGTVKTGKSAGKVFKKTIPVTHRHKTRPPGREPRKMKSPKRSEKRRKKGKDHHRAVQKAMKRKRSTIGRPLLSCAGRLSAPDQSVQIASTVLETISCINQADAEAPAINRLLNSTFGEANDLDSSFLRGGAAEIGVSPSKVAGDDLIHQCLVARALWDTHWREEWCGIYATRIDIFAPFTSKPAFSVALEDIKRLRTLELSSERLQLPGFPILVVETALRCHYLAFETEKKRENFFNSVNEALSAKGDAQMGDAVQWQSFQAAMLSTLSNGHGKWASVVSSTKSKRRTIFNNRCLAFDVEPFDLKGGTTGDSLEEYVCSYIMTMLSLALSLDQNSLENEPEKFLKFLNMTSRLQSLPLSAIDFRGSKAFCIFINLFHCLLQHSLLLAVHGPPTRRSAGHFMRCSCYEIGGDVFSLAELETHVLRGNLARASGAKSPFVVAPKASREHRKYALEMADARLNLVLNHGTLANLAWAPVFSPDNLESELNNYCAAFLQKELDIDRRRKTVTLPKICEVFRSDFGSGDSLSCILFCLQFTDDEARDALMDLIDEGKQLITKYQHSCASFYFRLKQEPDASTRSSNDMLGT